MKVKNLKVFSSSQDELNDLADQYWYLGRDVEVGDGVLTVFALPRAEYRWHLGYKKGKRPKVTDEPVSE